MASVIDIIAIVPTIADNGPAVVDALNGQTTGSIATPGLAGGNIIAAVSGPFVSLPVNAQFQGVLGGLTLIRISATLANGASVEDIGVGDIIQIVSGAAVITAGVAFVTAGVVTSGPLLSVLGLTAAIGQFAASQQNLTLRDLMSSLTFDWITATNVSSPLILDLDGDGVETLGVGAIVHFDHAGDGFGERTGWVGKDDGLLVRDLDGDGEITSGAELFGNNTRLSNGNHAANGFLALAELDSNSDGKIDSNDAAWSSLQVWKDTNSDGVTDTSELLTLAQAGVGEIGLSYVNQGSGVAPDASGNLHQQVGGYVTASGGSRAMTDVWFTTSNWDTLDQRTPLTLSPDITALPDLPGLGNLGSLRQAMARDSSGALKAAVSAFGTASSANQRSTLLREVMFRWAGVFDLDPASRGNAIGDARILAFLEAVFVQNFQQNGGANNNPGGGAVPILQNIFTQLSSNFAAQMDLQGRDKLFYETINLEWNDSQQSYEIDADALEVFVRQQYAAGANSAIFELKRFGDNILALGSEELLKAISATGSFHGDEVDRTLFWLGQKLGNENSESIYGISGVSNRINALGGNDQINGAELNDMLDGGEGNDNIWGNAGNDTLSGGLGNDYLSGDAGDDTYLFNLGDGNDIIAEYSNQGIDTLNLGSGITTSNVQITRTGNSFSDLVFSFGGTDSITIRDYFYGNSNAGRVENIVFTDGTVWDFAALTSRLTTQGTANGDYLYGISGVSNRINGLGGGDQINGAELNDVLDGGEGNDNIWGNAGNDTLSGGLGNDYLSGDAGDDTYLFNLGDGNDIIAEYSNQGIDTLNLGSGITTSNVQITRTGNSFSDLVLSFGGTDSITIRDYFYGNSNAGRVENIVFTDGTVWDFAALTSRLTTQGTANGDYLYGISGVSNRINGLGGGDQIDGAELNDVLDGGEGNDNIWGNAGNDTLSGGLGNDYLSGDAGDDTYLFNLGDGNDIIAEYSNQGIDTLNLGSGITTSNVQITRTGNSFSDLVLSFGGTDSITIRDYFYGNSNAGRVENIVFTDGTVWDFAALTSRLTTQGTANGDYLYGISGVSNRINGLGGGDQINGAELNDVLDGGEGNDNIWGNAGNDTLSGGLGNDYLSGDAGDDTYLFNLGDGNDIIAEYSNQGIDTLNLGSGITTSNVQITRTGNSFSDLVLSFGGTDSITIRDYFYGNSNAGRVENIIFTDGTVWDFAALTSRLTTQGTANGDYLYGISGVSNRINGLGGGDQINGAELNDVLDGGEGNDNIWGNAGNDTLSGGLGNDYLSGDAGDDTYLFNLGDGNDTISDYDNTAGNIDTAFFGIGIAADQIWLQQVGNNLEVSLIGRNDKLVINNWYLGNGYHVERFRISNGLTLTDDRVQNLVQAMASFSPPATGQTTLPSNYQTSLSSVIATNWQ